MNPSERPVLAEDGPIKNWFGVTSAEVDRLFRFKSDPGAYPKLILYTVGILLTPITLLGALLGYTRAYNRFLKPLSEVP